MGVEDHAVFFATLRVMDDDSLFALFHMIHNSSVLSIGFVASAMVALLLQLIHMDAEMRTLRELWKGKVMPARLAVIFIRWNYVLTFILVSIYYFGHVPAGGCSPLIKTIYGLFTALWAMAGAIFLMRIRIIYARESVVNAAFTVLWLGVVASWVYVTTQISSTGLPRYELFPYAPTCVPARFPRRAVIGWVASLVFDCSVFVATYVRFRGLRAAKDQRLRSRQWLLQSNLQYFGTSMVLNTSLMLTVLLVNDQLLSHMGSAFGFVAQTVMATRLVFHAKGWSSGEADDDMILNTFNRNRRKDRGDNQMMSRVSYVVDQMVVTDANATRDGHIVPDDLERQQTPRLDRGESHRRPETIHQSHEEPPVPSNSFSRSLSRPFHVPFRRRPTSRAESRTSSRRFDNDDSSITDKCGNSTRNDDEESSEKIDSSALESSKYRQNPPSSLLQQSPGSSTFSGAHSEHSPSPRSTVHPESVPPPYNSRDHHGSHDVQPSAL